MSAEGPAPLDALLAFLEAHGSVVLLARNLEAYASVEARAALHAAGVLGSAPAAASWPCDVRGCAREVRSNHDGARRPLVAVCGQSPPACMPVELGFDDVAQQEVSVGALVVASCALLGATVDRASLPKLRERRALGDARAPILIASLADPPRDVFWAGSPRDMDLSAFCARRERVARATLVLVPTSKHVPLDVAARFAQDEHVEVRALAHWLEVEDAKLAVRARREPEAMPASPPPAPIAMIPATRPGIAGLLGATRWEQIRIAVVDGHTVRIEANGKSILRTFVELGFVDGRKKDVVTPIGAWGLLLLFCKQKRLKPSAYAAIGKPFAAKKAVERIGSGLRESFGLEDHPIHSYSKQARLWEARFRTDGEAAGR